MKIFHAADLAPDGICREFLRVPSMSLGMYKHAAGTEVPQSPHGEDEVYHVLSGRGVIEIGGTDHSVAAGSIVCVPARVPHHFHSVTEDLSALVIFAPAEGARERGTDRLNVPAGTKWERDIAYSRAVRVGPFVAVSQTSAVGPDGVIAGGADPHQQAVHALRNVEKALCDAGATLRGVVRTRIYCAKFEDWPEVARAHADMFGEIKPAITLLTCTMVSPEILVEFEADAVVW